MNKKLIGILLGVSFVLAGCGQSGPLYLPPPPKPAKSMPPKQSTVQANIENSNSNVQVLPQED
ncbi:MAG: LPS translocon maturation chaperone LptM [Gammaproteobacteria bacterium]